MDISCVFATSLDTPDHVVLAEALGYRRAWCYDSPAIYPDVWMVLGAAAARTSTIGLGPGVLVPSLRHPAVNASAIAALDAWAPGRVAVAVGAGFTGRRALGQKPLRWSWVAAYVRALRGLLRGEVVEWQGAEIAMLHDEGCVLSTRPIDVPILIGAGGPKGRAVADELGDGVMAVGAGPPADTGGRRWSQVCFGTVLDDGEPVDSPAALAAWGAGVAVAYHASYERDPAASSALPGGAAWREAVEAAAPEGRRHLVVHERHLRSPNARDALALPAAAPLAGRFTLTGTADEVAGRVAALAAAGVTELAYQPSGPDIARELRAFAAATGVTPD